LYINTIEEQSFNPNDKKPHSSIKKNYDSLNRIVEERKFLGDSLRTLIKYEYKDSTRIIDDYWYWFENKNLSPGYNKFIETYNQKGQILLKVKIQYPNLYSEKTIYSYRYDDKLDSEVTFSGNSILAKIIKYDYY